MDHLPGNPENKIIDPTIKEFEIGGQNLKFRKAKLVDVVAFNQIRRDTQVTELSAIYLLAHLLVDPEKTETEKRDFFANLDIVGIRDYLKIDQLLIELGVVTVDKKPEDPKTQKKKGK